MEEIKVCVIGSKGAGKTTLISSITKQINNFMSVSDIEKQMTNVENYNAIELKQTINGKKYTFFEFPTHSDYEKCVNNGGNFDAVLLVVDCTGMPPEEEMQDALNISNTNNCVIITFINKQDDCDDEEMLELVTMQTMATLETEQELTYCGSALEAIEGTNQYFVESVKGIINVLNSIEIA